MGTTCMHRPYDVKQYFTDQWTFENDTIKSTPLLITLKLDAMYGAVEHYHKDTGEREVFAAVSKITYVRGDRDYYNFCVKDMSEHMGPYLRDCPRAVLDLLTPTTSEYAIEWRRDCYANLDKPKPFTIFVDGEVKATYAKVKAATTKAAKLAAASKEGFALLKYKDGQAWAIYPNRYWIKLTRSEG